MEWDDACLHALFILCVSVCMYCLSRLTASDQALSANRQSQKQLQQELGTCKRELQEAAARADAAHSEALSYLSQMRQQDKQAEIDRSASARWTGKLQSCLVVMPGSSMHAAPAPACLYHTHLP